MQVSKELNFYINRMLEKNPDSRPNITEVMSNSLLENIKLDPS